MATLVQTVIKFSRSILFLKTTKNRSFILLGINSSLGKIYEKGVLPVRNLSATGVSFHRI
jgi:hypothetical protein